MGRVRVLGVDGTGVRYGGKTHGVVVAVDMGTGPVVALAEWRERDAGKVVEWLQPRVGAYGVEVLGTSDLGSYRKVTEALGVREPVCPFHRRRWALRARRGLKRGVGSGQ